MENRLRQSTLLVITALLIASAAPPLAAEQAAETSSALAYQPPVYTEETITLLEAVRITLEHQPNIRLQAEDELANAAGTAVTRFDPEPAIRHERVSYIPLGMGCVGSFPEICGFLEGLEGLRSAIWIKNLRLDGSGKDRKNVTCDLGMAVFTYNSENSDYVEHSD